ncbi:MAG: hypothetical protein WCC12_12405 [Anaerolineales bacterium]
MDMNITALSSVRILMRIVFAAALCALISLPPARTARADGAPPPDPDLGGVAPYQPIETNVQMTSETVLIDVLPNPTRWTSTEFNWKTNKVKVRASFTLRNQGGTEEKMQVIFPMTRLDYAWVTSSYRIIESSFVAMVNGTPVPTIPVSTPPELQATPEGWDSDLPDGHFYPDVRWAGFDVTFPVHEDVIVEVEYLMWGYIVDGLQRVDYILETGAGWYGRILSADIILRLPYPATGESVAATPAGCVLSGNEVQCKRRDFEPKRKDNITFAFIDTNEWSPILELRARVEQYPDDADAWSELGWRYERLGFWHMESHVSVANQHLADLAIEAFGNVAALRHRSGDAHLDLARVLWFGTPVTEDAALQRVLLELQLAASNGISRKDHYDYLAGSIRQRFPDLEPSLLPVPILLTATPTSPAVSPVAIVPAMSLVPTLSPLQKMTAMAVGNYHTCVLTDFSEVRCQGWNIDVPVITDVKAVVAGDLYTCVLTTSGGVKCAGRNNFGQLGDGTTIDRDTFMDVTGLTAGVSALAAGDNHTCALMSDASVKCWGRNYFGELGDGTTAYSLVPVDVRGLSGNAAALVAGSDHTCAYMLAGGIKCWGANESGQLGDGSLINRLEPVGVLESLQDMTALAAGFAHSCALDSQGQVWCWGDNSYGQLGNGNYIIHTEPVMVSGLDHDVVEIAAGNEYSCALTGKGGVKCWGKNDLYPDPLDGDLPTAQPQPYDVPGLTSDVASLAAGYDHLCALLKNGRVQCSGVLWFGYDSGEVGLYEQPASTPAQGLTPIVPVPPATAAPAATPSSTSGLAWGLGLFAAACALLLLLLRRLRVRAKR